MILKKNDEKSLSIRYNEYRTYVQNKLGGFKNMPRVVSGRKSITFEITEDRYKQIQTLAAKRNTSMNAVVREYVEAGLNGTLTEANMEVIVPIIRKQLQDILKVHTDRLAAMESKTCIQAGAAAYLCAEVLSRFLPENKQIDYMEAYESARRKAVQYLKGKNIEGSDI